MTLSPRSTLRTVPVLVAAISLAACSASIGTKQVDKAEVAKQITAQLTQQTGKTPDNVTCPDNLDVEVGATLDCTLTANRGAHYGVHVTVSSVDDGSVKFDIKVADHLS